MIQKQDLINDFRQIGINQGDVVFIRISYKSIGKVDGGGDTVLDALLDVIGDRGTLVATAFPKRQNQWLHALSRHKVVYEKGMKPSTGLIPTLMAKRDNAFFSSNPITPFVAIGYYAKKITDAHTPKASPYSLLEEISTNYHAKCLRIGGNVLVGTTHLAFTEALRSINAYQIREGEGMYYRENGKLNWMKKNISCFCYNSYKDFYETYIHGAAVLAEGKVGDGQAVITDMFKTYCIEKDKLVNNPQMLQCNDENCLICRCSYSYSDMSLIKYVFKQIKKKNDSQAKDRIKSAIKLFVYRQRCI